MRSPAELIGDVEDSITNVSAELHKMAGALASLSSSLPDRRTSSDSRITASDGDGSAPRITGLTERDIAAATWGANLGYHYVQGEEPEAKERAAIQARVLFSLASLLSAIGGDVSQPHHSDVPRPNSPGGFFVPTSPPAPSARIPMPTFPDWNAVQRMAVELRSFMYARWEENPTTVNHHWSMMMAVVERAITDQLRTLT